MGKVEYDAKGEPFYWATSGGLRRHRYYPRDAAKAVVGSVTDSAWSLEGEFELSKDAALLDPDWCRDEVGRLREALAQLHRFEALLDARAKDTLGVRCASCETRFYPSRKDARYCSGRCRTRGHRAGGAR